MLVSAFLCLCSSSRFGSRDCTAALVGQAPDSRTHRSRNDGLDSSSSVPLPTPMHASHTHSRSPADTPTCTSTTGWTNCADAAASGRLLLLPPSLARLPSPCSFIASLLNSPALIIPPHPSPTHTQPHPTTYRPWPCQARAWSSPCGSSLVKSRPGYVFFSPYCPPPSPPPPPHPPPSLLPSLSFPYRPPSWPWNSTVASS